MPVPAAALSKA